MATCRADDIVLVMARALVPVSGLRDSSTPGMTDQGGCAMTMVPPDDEQDVEGHRLATNDNEVVVPDDAADTDEVDADVEGHRLASNDNEVIVDD
jgi:hypothetical protein